MVKLSFYTPRYFEYMKGGQMVNKCIYECEVINTFTGAILTSFKVEGISTCSANDVYNTTKGNIIADSRAKAKAYTIARDLISSREVDVMNAKIESYQNLIAFHKKMQYLKKQEDQHLNYVLNHNDN